MDKKYCAGCEDDFYNGHNPYDVKECWCLKGAKRELYRIVPVDLCPPYLHIPEQRLPTCYKKKRHVKVKANALDSEGHWKSSW